MPPSGPWAPDVAPCATEHERARWAADCVWSRAARKLSPMDLHLRGKTVLITGASKGIGAAAAEVFAEEGCDLILAARSGDALSEIAGRLAREHNIKAVAHPADL